MGSAATAAHATLTQMPASVSVSAAWGRREGAEQWPGTSASTETKRLSAAFCRLEVNDAATVEVIDQSPGVTWGETVERGAMSPTPAKFSHMDQVLHFTQNAYTNGEMSGALIRFWKTPLHL